jgi:hypothetical protein
MHRSFTDVLSGSDPIESPSVLHAVLTTMIHRLRPDLEPFRTAHGVEAIVQAMNDATDPTALWVRLHHILDDLDPGSDHARSLT